MHHYCAIYDIGDDRLRLKVSKWCKKAGLRRLQKSVFVGFVRQTDIDELVKKVSPLLPTPDRFSVFALDPADYQVMLDSGVLLPEHLRTRHFTLFDF